MAAVWRVVAVLVVTMAGAVAGGAAGAPGPGQAVRFAGGSAAAEAQHRQSLVQRALNPWADLASRYEDGGIVEGEVTKLAPFGAFVRLEDGVEGLAHSSDLGDTSLDSIHEGASGKFRILSTDVPRRRIRLEPTELVVETEDPSDAESVDGEGPDIDELSGGTDVDPAQQTAAAAEAVQPDDTNTEADDSIDEADDSKSTVKADTAAAEEETDEDTSSDSADIVDEDAMIESEHKAES